MHEKDLQKVNLLNVPRASDIWWRGILDTLAILTTASILT